MKALVLQCFAIKQDITHWVYNSRLINILSYKLSTTNDQLTSKAGLLAVTLMMEQLELSKYLDEEIRVPKSNNAIATSSHFETLIFMQHLRVA